MTPKQLEAKADRIFDMIEEELDSAPVRFVAVFGAKGGAGLIVSNVETDSTVDLLEQAMAKLHVGHA